MRMPEVAMVTEVAWGEKLARKSKKKNLLFSRELAFSSEFMYLFTIIIIQRKGHICCENKREKAVYALKKPRTRNGNVFSVSIKAINHSEP